MKRIQLIVQYPNDLYEDGTDEVFNTWNFAGGLKTSIRKRTGGSTVTTIANRYEYDHMGGGPCPFAIYET